LNFLIYVFFLKIWIICENIFKICKNFIHFKYQIYQFKVGKEKWENFESKVDAILNEHTFKFKRFYEKIITIFLWLGPPGYQGDPGIQGYNGEKG
jgi:hypothetical protein